MGCTYKCLNVGAGSPAFAYVRSGLQLQLRQRIWGWFGQQDQFAMGAGYEPQAGIGRYLAGTPPVLGLLGVDAAVETVELAGIRALWAKSQQLTDVLVDLARNQLEPLGATLASPTDPGRRGAHVAVAHPMAWPWCKSLIDRQMVIGDFRPPDVIRLARRRSTRASWMCSMRSDRWPMFSRLASKTRKVASVSPNRKVRSLGSTRPPPERSSAQDHSQRRRDERNGIETKIRGSTQSAVGASERI